MSSQAPERRRHRRENIDATMVVFSRNGLRAAMPVQDLSATGARLACSVPTRPGGWIRLALQVPGLEALPIKAQVVRRWAGAGGQPFVAVSFHFMTPVARIRLGQAIAAAKAPSRELTVRAA